MMRCGIDATNLWHCVTVTEIQICLILAVNSLFCDLVPLIFFLIKSHTFSMRFSSGELIC